MKLVFNSDLLCYSKHALKTVSGGIKSDLKAHILQAVFVHVRFAMMSPSELAKILVRPICQHHMEFFVERVAIGMSYHSGQEERIREIRGQENGALQFTPRLYTTDVWGLSMAINGFDQIEDYRSFVACFFSLNYLSECHEGEVSLSFLRDSPGILIGLNFRARHRLGD